MTSIFNHNAHLVIQAGHKLEYVTEIYISMSSSANMVDWETGQRPKGDP